MDSNQGAKSAIRNRGVRVETLGLVAGSAIFGAIAAVIMFRLAAGGTETISTAGLLGFLIMAGLSVAAIVLSLVAIGLSRLAERTIEQKADEMNRLQHEMVARTIEAIDRLESSVAQLGDGVADTVQECFGKLSEEIQEALPSHDVLRADMTEAVERSLAEVLVPVEDDAEPEPARAMDEDEPFTTVEPMAAQEDLIPEAIVDEEPVEFTEEAVEKADRRYDEFKDIVLLGVANFPGVVSRKIGEGQYRTQGDDLVDGAFVVNYEKLAVCAFCEDSIIRSRFMGKDGKSFEAFLNALLEELRKKHFSRVFLVFNRPLQSSSPYARALNAFSQQVDSGMFERFELFEGSPDIIIPQLTERVSQLMDAEISEEHDETLPEFSFRQVTGS